MEQNLKRFGVRSHHNQLGNATVERFGCFVSTLFELLEVSCLLNDVEDRDGELRVGERKRLRVWRAGAS